MDAALRFVGRTAEVSRETAVAVSLFTPLLSVFLNLRDAVLLAAVPRLRAIEPGSPPRNLLDFGGARDRVRAVMATLKAVAHAHAVPRVEGTPPHQWPPRTSAYFREMSDLKFLGDILSDTDALERHMALAEELARDITPQAQARALDHFRAVSDDAAAMKALFALSAVPALSPRAAAAAAAASEGRPSAPVYWLRRAGRLVEDGQQLTGAARASLELISDGRLLASAAARVVAGFIVAVGAALLGAGVALRAAGWGGAAGAGAADDDAVRLALLAALAAGAGGGALAAARAAAAATFRAAGPLPAPLRTPVAAAALAAAAAGALALALGAPLLARAPPAASSALHAAFAVCGASAARGAAAEAWAAAGARPLAVALQLRADAAEEARAVEAAGASAPPPDEGPLGEPAPEPREVVVCVGAEAGVGRAVGKRR